MGHDFFVLFTQVKPNALYFERLCLGRDGEVFHIHHAGEEVAAFFEFQPAELFGLQGGRLALEHIERLHQSFL